MEMDPVLLYMISHCNHAGEEMQIVVVMGLVVSLPDQASIWKFRWRAPLRSVGFLGLYLGE